MEQLRIFQHHRFPPRYNNELKKYFPSPQASSNIPSKITILPFSTLLLSSSTTSTSTSTITMALKAVHASDVPTLAHVPEPTTFSTSGVVMKTTAAGGSNMKSDDDVAKKAFVVGGHRGLGMNILETGVEERFRAVKENSILSFNAASKFPLDFIEFDVQVTSDGYPIIFHDDVILSEENGIIHEKRVTDLTWSEFLSYGPQKEPGKPAKQLMRKTKDGKILSWNVEKDDSHCTLKDAFEQVEPSLGFNIELKFDDHFVYQQDHLTRVVEAILKVVFEYAKDRPVFFSSFQPDAALLVRKLQTTYPVFFLTDGGLSLFYDTRRNSLEEAMKLCLEGGLQGIVSADKAIFRNPGAVSKIKDAKLTLFTYGKLNNVPEAVYMQHLMGVDGVIVDHVQEITQAVSNMIRQPSSSNLVKEFEGVDAEVGVQKSNLNFSPKEISFLLKLIPQLILL